MKHQPLSSRSDKIFYTVDYLVLGFISLLVLYPLIYIVAASFSSPSAVSAGEVFLWPVDISFAGYTAVFNNSQIVTGYLNSIFYAVLGTSINLVITMAAAYPLSRSDLFGNRVLMFIFTFTMMFSGGLIPSYLLMKELKLINTIWSVILPGALSVYNMIIARTFIRSTIPDELLEASQIDGCTNMRFLMRIVLPLSKSLIAILVLFYAVGHWNAWFNAFLYLNDTGKYPLQLVLRNILISNTVDSNMIGDSALLEARREVANLLKYSLIVVSTVPVLLIYPFVQKHFVKGVMIGSLKG